MAALRLGVLFIFIKGRNTLKSFLLYDIKTPRGQKTPMECVKGKSDEVDKHNICFVCYVAQSFVNPPQKPPDMIREADGGSRAP